MRPTTDERKKLERVRVHVGDRFGEPDRAHPDTLSVHWPSAEH